MRIGILSDMHLGYMRGTRDNAQGVNVREQDVLDAAQAAVDNLVSAGVEAIVDLGDLFHVPAPKKRALLHAVHMINNSGLPWFSANGNHTLQRTKSDLHVYDVLHDLCPNFHGYAEPYLIPEIGAYVIPYGTEVDALKNVPPEAKFLAGHFACDDVPFPGEHVSAKDDLPNLPIFLGHYHTRHWSKYADKDDDTWASGSPVYIGATDRFAWGEWENPTGVAVFDTKIKQLDFIEHETRSWIDLSFGAEEVTDGILRVGDFEGKIVRVNVEATPSEYHGIDIKAIRDIAKGALEFQIRRAGTTEAFSPVEHSDSQTYSLIDAWRGHIERNKMAAAMRKQVLVIGERALASAGVGE